jgi:hypothetical protein
MKLNINRIALITVGFFFFNCAVLQAQSHQEHVTIVGSFKPSLGEFKKINITPEVETTSFEMGNAVVSRIDTVLASEIELELITPINLKTEDSHTGFNNFVLAGIGTRISPVFVYRHNSKLSKNTAFGLGISHHSSWLNKPEFGPSSFMNNNFNLSLDNKINNYKVKSKLFYKGEILRFYGFHPDDFPSLDYDLESITQNLQTIGIQSFMQSNTKSTDGIYHELGIDYQYFHDKFQTKEHNISISGSAEKSYKWLKFNAKQSVSLEAEANTYFNSDTIETSNNLQMSLLPSVKLSGDFYLLKIGFTAVLHSHENSNIHIYPALEGGLFLLNRSLKFYATLGGNSQRINFQKLANENPYVNSILPMRWQQTKLDFKGGVKALVLPGLDFNFGIEYRKTDDEVFFVTDSTSIFSNNFSVVYDDVKVIGLLGEVSYELNQQINLKFVYRYNKYTNSAITTAFYKPENQLKITGEFDYNEKLKFTSSIYYVGERMASTYLASKETIHILSPYVDLNVGGIYKINDSFEVFVQLNNLLNWQYERFYNYPVNGVEFYGGITVRF